MKKGVVLIVVFFISLSVFSQRKVRDHSKIRQEEAKIFRKWGKYHFRPRWYYWLFHNTYRSGADKRLIWQTSVTTVTSKIEKDKAEIQADKVHQDFVDENIVNIDKMYNVKYNLLYKDQFDEVFYALYSISLKREFKVLKTGFITALEHNTNKETFLERKKIIDKSYARSFEKNKAYDKLLDDMKAYIAYLYKIKKKTAVLLKYK